ncbi:MAG: DUF1697 domain-containing protein [Gemmatimonadales bacterium]
MNCKMPELKAAFEAAGFKNVKTLLSSGNVVFDATSGSEKSIQNKAEAAMEKHMGKRFSTIVRSVDALRDILASDPYSGFQLAAGSKKVVTFLKEAPRSKPSLPVKLGGATIYSMGETEAFTAYERIDNGPVFMTLIEKTFGKDVTTRTWDTIARVAR